MTHEHHWFKQTKDWVKNYCLNENTDHDWFHIKRVQTIAYEICKTEKCDLFMVQMIAVLHDMDDHKISHAFLVDDWLDSLGVFKGTIERITTGINEVATLSSLKPTSLEARIVQDADRLDSIGAIGIARCFTEGGATHRSIYDPANLMDIKPPGEKLDHRKSYSSIRHFYDNLLNIESLMHTAKGKQLAEIRHKFLIEYLDRFFLEWNLSEKETQMIKAYLVQIKNRLLGEHPQIPEKNLFWSRETADEYRQTLITAPIRFLPQQVKVFEINVHITGEIDYNENV